MLSTIRSSILAIVTAILVPSSLCAQTAADADFDGSGQVDFTDFLQFASADPGIFDVFDYPVAGVSGEP